MTSKLSASESASGRSLTLFEAVYPPNLPPEAGCGRLAREIGLWRVSEAGLPSKSVSKGSLGTDYSQTLPPQGV